MSLLWWSRTQLERRSEWPVFCGQNVVERVGG
jgi:hypothetical protein